MSIDEMGVREVLDFLNRKNITQKQREQAERRLKELMERDVTRQPEKQVPSPAPRPTMEQRGYMKAAKGGKIRKGYACGGRMHRGRKANYKG